MKLGIIQKIQTLLLMLLAIWNVTGQVRYRDAIFEDIQKKTFTYADTLQLDFYAPKGDQERLKPLVLLVHGGGFVAGQRNGTEEIGMATKLAQKGYAVASMDYGLTMKGRSFGCDCPVEDKIETYRNAVQDASKALNYLVTYATDFQLDPNQIILMGSSAGAEIILNLIVMKEDYRFKSLLYPSATIIGAISFSGAVINSDYLNPKNAVPTLFFHGQKDDKVPFAIGSHHDCQASDSGYLMLDGPKEIARRLKDLGTSFYLLSDPEGGHEWADIAYKFPDVVSNFLYQHILGNESIQEEATIHKPEW